MQRALQRILVVAVFLGTIPFFVQSVSAAVVRERIYPNGRTKVVVRSGPFRVVRYNAPVYVAPVYAAPVYGGPPVAAPAYASPVYVP